jgi:toxin-antitoxin system PIN domain toxin
MIVPDVNTLLFAVNTASDQHRLALQALADGYASPRGVGFAWVALLAFLRLSTRNGIFPKPLSVEDALRVVDHWLAHPNAQAIHPGSEHILLMRELLLAAGTAGNLTTDAHLAALAIEHDATIVSFDRDFARFAKVKWTLPVVAKQ